MSIIHNLPEGEGDEVRAACDSLLADARPYSDVNSIVPNGRLTALRRAISTPQPAAQESAQGDGMLPDALVPHAKEWYRLCERRFYAERITISGELAEAIVEAVCSTPHPDTAQPAAQESVCIAIERGEGYEDVHPQILADDFVNNAGRGFRWAVPESAQGGSIPSTPHQGTPMNTPAPGTAGDAVSKLPDERPRRKFASSYEQGFDDGWNECRDAVIEATPHSASSSAGEYPGCSGNPASCPENEGFGCCNAARSAEEK